MKVFISRIIKKNVYLYNLNYVIMEITISSKHRKRLMLVEQVARELGLSISKPTESSKSPGKKMVKSFMNL